MLAVAVVASGCVARPGTGVATVSARVSEAEALILPAPGTQSVVGVVQRKYANAIEQEVALSTEAATPGQNFLGVTIFGPAETVAMPAGTLTYRALSHSAIRAEIRRHLPGRALAISSHFVRNNYGPFGYAYGPGADRDGCLYGWQQIRSDAADRDIRGNQGMIQVRLRVCQAGASEKDLVALMYGYTITGGFSGATWNPYGRPPAVDPEIGGGEPLVVEPETHKVVAERRAPVRRAVAAEVEEDAAPITRRDVVIVPSPTATATGGASATTEDAVVVPSPVCRADGSGGTSCD